VVFRSKKKAKGWGGKKSENLSPKDNTLRVGNRGGGQKCNSGEREKKTKIPRASYTCLGGETLNTNQDKNGKRWVEGGTAL